MKPKLIFLLNSANAGYSLVGCYSNKPTAAISTRVFSIDSCSSFCLNSNEKYSLLGENQCFCLNEINDMIQQNGAECGIYCSSGEPCGGNFFRYSVYAIYTDITNSPPTVIF